MTDAKPIDLSTLERGDEVIFRDGKKGIVNDIRERKSIVFDGVEITFHLVVYCTNDYSLIKNEFYPNGQSRWFDYQDIIEIIKNPKRWTDEDMKAAFEAGKPTLESLFKHDWNFDELIQQYKERKHEQ